MTVQNIDRMSDAWANFSKFVDFTKQEGVKNDTIARYEQKGNGANSNFNLVRATDDKIHAFKRSGLAKTANDRVRAEFAKSVCKLFGIEDGKTDKLPPEVKKAMVLGDYDKGKPLSARRIKAVSAAIENWEGSLTEFSLSEKVQNSDLEGIQNEIDQMLQDDEKYRGMLKQLAGDSSRSGHIGLSNEVEADFQENPDATFSANKMVQAWMLNGHQVRVEGDDIEDKIKHIEDKIKHIEDFFKNQFRVNSNDGKELTLCKSLSALCHQGTFSLGANIMGNEDKVFGAGNNLFNGLKPVGNQTQQASHIVNIVKAPNDRGYDIYVKQRYFGILGFSNPKLDGRQTKFFDPQNPGSLTVSCTYHLEMVGDVPKVSYAKKPVVKADFPKSISEKKYRSQVKKFIMANMDEIVDRHVDEKTKNWWKSMTQKDQKKAIQEFITDLLNGAIESGDSLPLSYIGTTLDEFVKDKEDQQNEEAS